MKNWKRTFSVIWTGQFLSFLTSATVGYAAIFWLSLESRSASVLAIATIAALLPQAIIGPFAGTLIDRWNRKNVMIISDLFIALWSIVLAVLIFYGNSRVEFVYFILVLRSIGDAFHTPAMQASTPLIVPEEELTRVAGINQIIYSSTNIAGPALGALLLANFDLGVILVLDAIGAVVASISLIFVKIPNPKIPKTKARILNEMKKGYNIIRNNIGIFQLFIFSMLFLLFVMPVSVIFPLITLEHFLGGAYEMSMVEVFWGIGTIVGGLIIGLFKFRWNEIIAINFTLISTGLFFAGAALLPPNAFLIFIVLTTIGAVVASIHSALFTSVLQKNIASEALGRVFSMYYSISVLPSLIGVAATGFIADSLGPMLTMFIAGVAIIIIGIATMFAKQMIAIGSDEILPKQYKKLKKHKKHSLIY